MINCFFLVLLCFSAIPAFSEEVPAPSDREWLGCTDHLTEEEIQWLEATYKRLDAEEKAELEGCIGTDDYDDDDED